MITAVATVAFENSDELCQVTAECVSLKTVITKIQAEIDKESDHWFEQWSAVTIVIKRL